MALYSSILRLNRRCTLQMRNMSYERKNIRQDVLKDSNLSKEQSQLEDMPISDLPNPFEKEKAQCILCKFKVHVDYKNVKLLSQFVSPYTGRVYGRHITGLCSEQQKLVESEILKSQNAGFMAYYLKQVEFLHDPKLFDPEHPIRPHRF